MAGDFLSGVTSGERLLEADELPVKLELDVRWLMLSSIGVEIGTPPPLNGKECGSARKEKG